MAQRIAAAGLVVFVSGLAVLPSAHAAKPSAPRFAKSLVAVPAGGTVTVKARGKRAALKLRRATSVGFGATIDATRGTVRLVAAAARRGTATWEAKAGGGAFTIAQSKAAKGEVELRLAGGGLSCRPPYGAAKAGRQLRVRTRGRFTTRSCFGRVRLKSVAAARGVRAASGPADWTLVEYPGGWRIRLVSNLLLEVTDLKTGKVALVGAPGLYNYIYSQRPVLPPGTPPGTPPAAGATLDPQGDLLPCGFTTCQDVDLRSASLAVAGGVATFTVESYVAYPGPAALPVFELWTSNPTTGQANYNVDPCYDGSPACPAGNFAVTRLTSGPPYAEIVATPALSYAGPNVVRYAVPLSALGGATAFKWITGSFTCGFTDRIPDTGFLSYPQGTIAKSRPQARPAC